MAFPDPEEMGGLSTIPQKEKLTPAEHYADRPNFEKAEREGGTAEEHYEADKANKREIDNDALAQMGSSVQNFVGAGYKSAGTERDVTPESKRGYVEPVRVTEARRNEEAPYEGHAGEGGQQSGANA